MSSTSVVDTRSPIDPPEDSTVDGPPSKRPAHRMHQGWWITRWSTLVLVVLFVAALATRSDLVLSRLALVALLIVLPGATVVGAARIRLSSHAAQLALVAGTGVAVVMAWSALAGALVAIVGNYRAFATAPLAIGIIVISLVAAAACPRGIDPVLALVPSSVVRPSYVSAIGFAMLPVLGLVAAERLNNRLGTMVTYVVLAIVAASVVAAVVWAERWSIGRIQWVLYSVALTVVYLYSFRSNHLYGFDIQQEFQRFNFASNTGRWLPPKNGDPYSAMLSITALPVAVSKVSGLSGLAVFKGCYPLLLAAVPALVLGFVRRWLPARGAVVAAAYIIVLAQFAGQLSAITRQQVGFFYLALLLIVLFDAGLARTARTVTSLFVLGALVVSHYTTSYLVMQTLLATAVGYWVVRKVRTIRGAESSGPPFISGIVVLGGIAMVVLWDGVITRTAKNVTGVSTAFANRGPSLLPSGNGSLLSRWINAGVSKTLDPSAFYQVAKEASTKEHWLNPYPTSITSAYPAAAPASPITSVHGIITSVLPLVAQLILVAIVVGTAIILLRNRRTPVPLEVAVLASVTVALIGLIRISGTLAEFYNQDRAQVQAAMVLSVPLAYVVTWLETKVRAAAVAIAVFVLLVLFASSFGLVGGQSPVLTNAGRAYDNFYITDQDVAAAGWLDRHATTTGLIWSDRYGTLRIWAGTPRAATNHQDLTPATIDQGSWVLLTGANVAGRSYGQVENQGSTFATPTNFLQDNKNRVYSSPNAQVYR